VDKVLKRESGRDRAGGVKHNNISIENKGKGLGQKKMSWEGQRGGQEGEGGMAVVSLASR